jgi:hypothetical protein
MKTKIENIDELKSVLSNKEKTVSSVEHFMQPFNLGRTLKNYSNIKQKGLALPMYWSGYVRYRCLE